MSSRRRVLQRRFRRLLTNVVVDLKDCGELWAGGSARCPRGEGPMLGVARRRERSSRGTCGGGIPDVQHFCESALDSAAAMRYLDASLYATP